MGLRGSRNGYLTAFNRGEAPRGTVFERKKLCSVVVTVAAWPGVGVALLVRLPGRGPQAGDGGHREGDDDDAEGEPDRDLRRPGDVLAVVDERQLVLVHRVEHELDADEPEQERQ